MFSLTTIQLNYFDHFYFLIIGILIPIISLLSHKNSEDSEGILILPPKKHLYYSNGLMLMIGGLIVLTIWNVNHRNFSDLGFYLPTLSKEIIYLAVGIIMIYLIDALYSYFAYVNGKVEIELSEIMPTSWNDYFHFTFLAFCAGIFEEIMFRGFLISYISVLFSGNDYTMYFAILIPSFLFSISHLYQGWISVIKIFVISLLFGCLYILSKSLLYVIIIHVFVDLFSAFLLVLAFSKTTKNK